MVNRVEHLREQIVKEYQKQEKELKELRLNNNHELIPLVRYKMDFLKQWQGLVEIMLKK